MIIQAHTPVILYKKKLSPRKANPPIAQRLASVLRPAFAVCCGGGYHDGVVTLAPECDESGDRVVADVDVSYSGDVG